MLCVWDAVRHKRMGFLLAVGLHQPVIAHDLAGAAVGDNAPVVYQHNAVAYLQDKLQVMGGDQGRLQVDPPRPPFGETDPVHPIRFHVLRIGDVAMASNPFELYLDYGFRIKARSRPVLTFIVQLADGKCGYLPTAKAVAGGGYSAEEFVVGPVGGQVLVDETVRRINYLWP